VSVGTNRSLRILSLAPTSFFNDYGCHVRILEEARVLQVLGHSVTIVTYHKGKDVPGLSIVRTPPTWWRAQYEVGSSRHKFAFDVLLGWTLLRVLAAAARRGEQFDVIHGHLHEGALIGGVLGRLFGVPLCFDFQGSLTDEMIMHRFIRADGVAHRIFRWIEQATTRLPDAIVTSTAHAAEVLRAALPSRVQVRALPDGIDVTGQLNAPVDPAERVSGRAELGFGPEDIVVVYLGLLAQHQGIQNLIDAAEIVQRSNPRVRWLVMGYPQEALWRTRAQQAGVSEQMVFTGRVPYERMPRMLALGDIAAAPKLSLTEGSGKILNYMALGLPTVAFDTPAQREILRELGVYAPLGDSGALAECVVALAADPERRAVLSGKLRARVHEQFSWQAGGRVLVEIYRSILRGAGAATKRPMGGHE
jgi:glycosyltransferase involved in cell wall biosynthesis